jgi:hypothetical protein
MVLGLVGCTGYKHDPWTRGDTVRHTVFTGLMVVDWRQTREIVGDPQYHEHNLILGKEPSKGGVDLYFAGSWLVVTGGAWVLPSKYRKFLQYVGIVVEGGCVGHNYSIGLKGEW